MIHVRDIRKSFGSLRAVDGISFDVRGGEVLGLLGPNGAGKSTALAICSGLLAADAGSVDVAGLGSPREPAVRRMLGLAPQRIALYDQLSARENLAFLGRIHGVPHPARRADELLDLVGLLPRARDRVHSFSGGMQRRLNLVAALVHDPALLFLDEPTAGVDPQSRGSILETVGRLASLGKAVVYTTHYMEEAQRICTRVVIVDHGRVRATGSVAELLAGAAAAGDDLESLFLSLTGKGVRD